jgi:hypothetical protein
VRTYQRKGGFFPLWSYSRQTTPAESTTHVTGSCLVRLYDYKHEFEPATRGKPGGTNDYTRARVLWRLWHYERQNGDVSVDVFPAFTYDHKADGFRKVSFLWRFYRNERAPTGGRKVDVLFVPVKRS